MSSSNGQLGTIVSWKVPTTVKLTTLRDALDQANFDPKLARDLVPRNAFKRALREMDEGRIIRQLRTDGTLLYFQFTAEHLSKDRATYNREAEMWLNLETGEINSDVPELAEQARALMDAKLANRGTSDLSRLLQRIYDHNGADLVPIRESGGAYFVPSTHREIVDNSRTLLNAIGGSLRSFEVAFGSSDTSSSVADSLSDYLAGVIAEFRASCADLDREAKPAVVQRRTERIAELRQKLELYSGLLTGYSSAIKTQIDESEKQLMANLLRVHEESAA